MVTFEQGLMSVECNDTRSSPRRAPNMAKPKTREANTSIKLRSKQAQTCKYDDPNLVMWTLVYGR